jgi:hypothetical protein
MYEEKHQTRPATKSYSEMKQPSEKEERGGDLQEIAALWGSYTHSLLDSSLAGPNWATTMAMGYLHQATINHSWTGPTCS